VSNQVIYKYIYEIIIYTIIFIFYTQCWSYYWIYFYEILVEYEKPSNKLSLSIFSKSNSISTGTLNITSITGMSLKYPEEIVYKIKKEGK